MTAGFGTSWDSWSGKFANGRKQIDTAFNQWMDGLGKSFSHGWSQIESAFSNGASQIGAAFSSQWAGIKAGWDNVVHSFQNGWQQIQDFFSGHPVRAQIQYSNVVPPAPSGGGGGSLTSKPMAVGGIVRARPGGLPAIIGEAGVDEAVVPLTAANLAALSSGGGGGSTHITINEVSDPVGTANAVMRRLNARRV
jgi:hypothetical protein